MNQQKFCIIHCRVSSNKQAQEGESLDVQERLCLSIAERNGWKLGHSPWLEAFSGRRTSRPIFAEILRFLDSNPGKIHFYVFRSIDRFTRGGSFTYEGMKRELALRGVAMVDSNGVIQTATNTLEDVGFEYEWSRFSPSEITETVLANTAKAEVNTILTRMIGQEIRLTQKGYKIRGPQDGYKNERVYVEGRKRTIQVPDKERAKFFIAMYELRAAGDLTDSEIVERVNAMGFRTRVHRRWDAMHQNILGQGGGIPLTVKRLQEIIPRPIYCGVVWEKWTRWLPVKAPYEGLVSIDTYNAANRGKRFIRRTSDGLELLHNYHPERLGSIHHRNNPDYPFKGVILCPTCRKPFLGSASRSRSGKRHPAYHCSRKHPRIAFNKRAFEATVQAYFDRLDFSPEVISSLNSVIRDRYRQWQVQMLGPASQAGRTVTLLQAQKAETIRAFKVATSEIMRSELEADIERIDAELRSTQCERDRLEISEHHIEDYIAEVKSVMEHPGKLLENPQNTREQQRLFSLVFEQNPTYAEIANGTPKLTCIFRASEGVQTPESALVRLGGLEWNLIALEVANWRLRS